MQSLISIPKSADKRERLALRALGKFFLKNNIRNHDDLLAVTKARGVGGAILMSPIKESVDKLKGGDFFAKLFDGDKHMCLVYKLDNTPVIWQTNRDTPQQLFPY